MDWFFGGDVAALGWTPLLIFVARLGDVSLATIRIILISRGFKHVAPFVGFFEVLIWLLALSQVVRHLDRPVNYVAYAGGFSCGTWLGMWLEGKIALGLVAVRIITPEDASDLIAELRDARFGVTSFAARGVAGRVRLLFTVVPRKLLGRVLDITRRLHPEAFVSTSDVRSVSEGYFPTASERGTSRLLGLLRKGK